MKKTGSNSKFWIAEKWSFAWLVLLMGVLLLVAGRIQLNLFDTYEIFLNTRAIAFQDPSWYGWSRFALLPILLAPILWILHALAFGVSAFERATHFLAVLFWVGFLGSAYGFFRFEWDRRRALFVVVLMSLNPVLIHYAPTLKEDIPAAFFTTMAFCHYLKFRMKGHLNSWGWSLLFFCMAALTRYNLFFTIPIILVSFEILVRFSRNVGDQRLVVSRFILSGLIFFLVFFTVPFVLYMYLGRGLPGCDVGCRIAAGWIKDGGLGKWVAFWGGPSLWGPVLAGVSRALCSVLRWGLDFFSMCGYNAGEKVNTPFWHILEFLMRSSAGVLSICALVGGAISLKRRKPIDGLALSWFLTLFVFLSFLVWFKQARYLFPLFPAFYFFVGTGFFSLDEFLRQKREKGWWIFRRIGRGAICGVILVALPLTQALQELGRFRDPFYGDPLPKRLSLLAEKFAAGNHLFWVGSLYSRHPREYIFSRNDLETYIYYLGGPVIEFYTGRKVFFSLTLPWERFRPGDVIVRHRESRAYQTAMVPEKIGPLEIVQVKKTAFTSASSGFSGPVLYRSSDWPEAVVKVTGELSQLNLNGENFISSGGSAVGELFFDSNGGSPVVQKIDIQNGRFHCIVKNRGSQGLPTKIVVTSLEHKDYV